MTDDVVQAHEPQHAPHRKKYTFKKRDPVAAAKLEEERVASIKHVRQFCTNFRIPNMLVNMACITSIKYCWCQFASLGLRVSRTCLMSS